jgi:hypothetical protein
MPLPLLPNVVDLTKEALLAQASLTALVGTRVYDRVPGAPSYPLLVVTSVDEAESPEPAIGEARVQVDVWGKPMSELGALTAARLVTRTLQSVVRDLRGTWTAGKIVGAAHLNTIPQPDPDTGRTRFIVDLQINSQS